MYGILIAIHVLSCLVLMAVILLQAGKGGGLAETFGGGGGFQTLFGTKASTFLTRATAVFAVAFLVTSLSLAILSTKRGASLVEKEIYKEEKIKPTEQNQVPAQSLPEATQPQAKVTEEKKGESQPAASGEQAPQ